MEAGPASDQPTGRWDGVPAPTNGSPAAVQQQSGVFVDAVTGRHASTSAAELLAMRRLTWDKQYGWTYDAWIDDPARYALAGANGRFSLPALARGFTATLAQAAGGAAVALQQHRHFLEPVQQLLGLGRGSQQLPQRPKQPQWQPPPDDDPQQQQK